VKPTMPRAPVYGKKGVPPTVPRAPVKPTMPRADAPYGSKKESSSAGVQQAPPEGEFDCFEFPLLC
jgi:hypothetical protein